MALLEFDNFSFHSQGDAIMVLYGKRYSFFLSLKDLKNIDESVIINERSLEFPSISEKKATNKVYRLIDKGLSELTHVINGKPVRFIDESSGVPLLGSGEFGIVDRDTNILELKPLTGCNLDCIYCSVDEGENDKRYDILIDPYYLASEALAIAEDKNHLVEYNIGPHGEPLLYPFLETLLEELSSSSKTGVISVNTNGTLLTRERIDALKQAGLTRINLSLNTLDGEVCSRISGKFYPLEHVLEMIDYCRDIGMPVLLAPLVIPTITDNPRRDIEPLIKLAKTIDSSYPAIGFQNYLIHKYGRKPVKKQYGFDEFFELLKPFEKKYDITLTPKQDYNPFGIFEDGTVDKPFSKNQVVLAEALFPGRHKNEILCKAGNRVITVRDAARSSGTFKVKIVRNKNNIFLGVPA
ncbi:MAG: radical SAM protein [Nanoarchaeota archaeon]